MNESQPTRNEQEGGNATPCWNCGEIGHDCPNDYAGEAKSEAPAPPCPHLHVDVVRRCHDCNYILMDVEAPAPQAESELRCAVTGNLCGSDTWVPERPCRCTNCQYWLQKYLASRLERTSQPSRSPRQGPCSACGDGDTAMQFHSHEPSRPVEEVDWKARADSLAAELEQVRQERDALRAEIEGREFAWIQKVHILREVGVEIVNEGEQAKVYNKRADEMEACNARLRGALRQSLGQWRMYAEQDPDFESTNDPTLEGIEYRKCCKALEGER